MSALNREVLVAFEQLLAKADVVAHRLSQERPARWSGAVVDVLAALPKVPYTLVAAMRVPGTDAFATALAYEQCPAVVQAAGEVGSSGTGGGGAASRVPQAGDVPAPPLRAQPGAVPACTPQLVRLFAQAHSPRRLRFDCVAAAGSNPRTLRSSAAPRRQPPPSYPDLAGRGEAWSVGWIFDGRDEVQFARSSR